MKNDKDIDEVHDLTDPEKYRTAMKEEDRQSKAPCGKCIQRNECTTPFYCAKYKAWKKKYMEKRRA